MTDDLIDRLNAACVGRHTPTDAARAVTQQAETIEREREAGRRRVEAFRGKVPETIPTPTSNPEPTWTDNIVRWEGRRCLAVQWHYFTRPPVVWNFVLRDVDDGTQHPLRSLQPMPEGVEIIEPFRLGDGR